MPVPLRTLPADKLAYLRHLADAGDLMAQVAVLQLENTETVAATGAALVAGGTPDASQATVHVNFFGDAAGPVTVSGGFVQPDVPRSLYVVFGADWDGGDITITGTDQFDAVKVETFAANPGDATIGTGIFKTVVSAEYTGDGVGTHATNVAAIYTDVKIGLTVVPLTGSPVLLTADGVGEAVVFDAVENAFTPTTSPDGSVVFVLTFNL
jgi:hypothetical protein